jgi:hypothetical protein
MYARLAQVFSLRALKDDKFGVYLYSYNIGWGVEQIDNRLTS